MPERSLMYGPASRLVAAVDDRQVVGLRSRQYHRLGLVVGGKLCGVEEFDRDGATVSFT